MDNTGIVNCCFKTKNKQKNKKHLGMKTFVSTNKKFKEHLKSKINFNSLQYMCTINYVNFIYYEQ